MIIAIIPARGGSKGIPGKNIRLLAGKPLLAYSIEQVRNTPAVGRIFVSTDDPEIAAVAAHFGAESVARPPAISGDTASSEAALLHTLDWLLTTAHYEPELVVFLQATSPMRAPDDIKCAIGTLKREKADSLFSACRVEGFTWRLVDGAVAPVNYDPAKRPRRQELKEEIWEENGSLYIFKPWVLRKFNSRLGGKIAMHKMERAASLQIDEPGDFELIEQLLRYRQTTGLQDHGTTGPQEQAQRAEGGNRKPEEMTEGGNVKPEERGQWSVVSGQSSAANGQWSRIKLLVLDFDGVLTDNRVLVSEDGKESVLCDRGDGLGIGMLKAAGIQVIVISKERNPVVAARCRKLGIECIQGCDDKLEALKKRAAGGKLKAEIGDQKTAVSGQWSVVSGLKSDQIAYVGNDINDLECMRWVGLPIAVANAVPEVLAAARCVTRRPGGHGAIREVVECLLRSRKQTCR